MYSPDIVAGMIRAAFAEGVATGSLDKWDGSRAKADSASMLRVMSDPTVAERVLSLYRLWANCSPAGTTPEASWKLASGYMTQIRDLLGDPPLDTNPMEDPDGKSQSHG